MKRILKLLLPFLMAFALCLPVLAEEQRVFDNAGLLTNGSLHAGG